MHVAFNVTHRFTTPLNRVETSHYLTSRPLTPPCVRFRTRRFNTLRKQTLPIRLVELSPIGGVFLL